MAANLFRRFWVHRKGSTAVEFALVATPFLAILYAILQTALVFLAQEVLQTATTQASRLIMTGQAQSQSMTASSFKQSLCGQIPAMFSCASLYVNVQKFTSFTTMSPLNPLQNGTFNSGAMNYDVGGPGDIVLVQVFYQWPEPIGPLSLTLASSGTNYRLLQATAVFRNEPY